MVRSLVRQLDLTRCNEDWLNQKKKKKIQTLSPSTPQRASPSEIQSGIPPPVHTDLDVDTEATCVQASESSKG